MDINKMRDLKVLAEAATPGQWMTDGEYVNEHGNVLFAYVAHENSGRIAEAFANCLVKTSEQCRANAAFIAAANPSTVLALLAEIERLTGFVIRRRAQADEYDEALCKIAAQRDQLKAENEALRKDAGNWRVVERAMEQLKSDEQGAAIWSVCSRLLISIASDLNAARSVVTEEGVTKDGAEIGDWRVTVERLAMAKESSHG